jgi:endoribonuclease Dicer
VWKQLGIPFYPTLENRYLSTFGNLGPYSASLFLFFEIEHLLHNLRQERYISDDDYMRVIEANVVSQESHDEEIEFVLEILKDFKAFFPSDASSHDIPIPVNLDWCTPKVKVLVDLLVEFGTKCPAFQCVIFVEQRQIASTLSKLLQAIPELNSWIKTAFLVGQGTNTEGLLRSTDQYSGDPVKMFKDGLINVRESSIFSNCQPSANNYLVVATSVAEEGLDFKVNSIVLFPRRSDKCLQGMRSGYTL